jgi:hypothetical protein
MATLEETIASQAAELLIKAAEARYQATSSPDDGSTSHLLSFAATLESDAAKWEQRLRWWKYLQHSKRAKSP